MTTHSLPILWRQAMIKESPPAIEILRRELTRALANAIGHLAAAPDGELISGRDRLDDLLRQLRQFESQPESPSEATLAPSILVVDPDPTRDWSSDRYQVLDRANDALQGLAFAQELRPDAVVYNLPSYSLRDVSAIADLARVGIALRVVALTDDPADRQRLSVVRRPRLTTLPRDTDPIALGAALGVRHISPVARSPAAALSEQLTAREYEVLHLMAAGRANKQIAAALGVSIATAKFHVANILRKLDAENRTQALVSALDRGLLLR